LTVQFIYGDNETQASYDMLQDYAKSVHL